jgi:hypothetical protein
MSYLIHTVVRVREDKNNSENNVTTIQFYSRNNVLSDISTFLLYNLEQINIEDLGEKHVQLFAIARLEPGTDLAKIPFIGAHWKFAIDNVSVQYKNQSIPEIHGCRDNVVKLTELINGPWYTCGWETIDEQTYTKYYHKIQDILTFEW